jgi:hypothetical protein
MHSTNFVLNFRKFPSRCGEHLELGRSKQTGMLSVKQTRCLFLFHLDDLHSKGMDE